ncbi:MULTISPECIES: Bug family tripartite tricarboxylate transporter substrate binding protein [unclassified Cupriavidus]|uniref:Bug family tripartite tricarboxylate transporter substrate binding protein n=1 Tax=Cupriavidus sp. H19C3 TaxID=3241603 RepID=UPI003BF81C7B
MQRRTVLRTLAALIPAATLAAGPVAPALAADAFPSKPITIIVPFSVGGSTDLVARLVATGMSARGTSALVDNRTGGGGVIGWGTVARATPDGYTMLTTEMSYAIAATLLPKLPFDPKKSFQMVTVAASMPHVLVVNPSVPARTVQEFIALAKANPGKYYYGSGGNGTNTHLGGALFNSLAGVNLVHVPYRGAGAALQDLLGGQVQALITSLPTALPYIKTGKLRALMLANDVRSPVLPDVPAAPEVGMPSMVMKFWVGFSVPAGTPQPVVDKLNKEMVDTVNTPEIRKSLQDQGLDPVGSTPAQATRLLNDEIQRWGAVIKAAGIKAD